MEFADTHQEPIAQVEGTELNAEEDFRIVGHKIRELIFEGEEIKDELYVDLFIAAVRMKFTPKSKDELKNENLEKVQQEDDLRNQLA